MDRRVLPVGKQNFEEIRQEGMMYVDKTQYVWNLASTSIPYFLSRPRRFGKSLFTSTLECYFRGKKDLFKGLCIYDKENARGEDAWTVYPVITFSLSSGEYKNPDGLSDMLNSVLENVIQEYDLTGRYAISGETLSVRFRNVIMNLQRKTNRKVVVLVDEYDKPLLDTMYDYPEQEKKNRDLYKSFFSVLKDMDGYLRFVFFTGITKFTKVSIFSDLNQLTDISLSNDFCSICGITQQELETDFQPEITSLAEEEDLSFDKCLSELQKMYDGYHFSKKGVGVYNPYSLLNAFFNRDFGTYWFGSGTPEILIKKLQNSDISLVRIGEGVDATKDEIENYTAENDNPIPLFYQTGYLTICGYDREFGLYALQFPNDEVKYGFLNSLVPYVLGSRNAENPTSLRYMFMDLKKGDPESFINRLTALLGGISYPEGKQPDYEGEWSRQLYLILKLMGAHAQTEIHMATGRADCVVKTTDYIYVFEFKLDKPVEDAMTQIDDKGYTIPYQADSRKLYKVGVAFSSEKRNISDWKIAVASA